MLSRKILVVDDEEDICNQLSEVLVGEGYEVVTAGDGQIAWDIFRKSTYLVVVTDLKMPKTSGLKVLENIKKFHPATRVIIITGHGGKQDAIKALKLNAFDYIEKGPSKMIPDLLTAIQRAFTDAETQIKTEKEMLSFLTHTLRNTLSGGPQTVHQVLRLTHSIFGGQHEDLRIYKITNNIASLYSIFTSIDNMLEAYKFYVSEPSEVRRKWLEDKGGTVSLDYLIALVLKQTIGRILFEESNTYQLKNLLLIKKENSVKDVRESFLNDVLLSEDGAREVDNLLAWIVRYFPVLDLVIKDKGVYFNSNGIRFNLLFAIFSEMIFNSLKYLSGANPIQVKWKKQGAKYVFSCRNEYSQASTEKTGSQKGLAFINGLTRIIEGMEFIHKADDNFFVSELRIDEEFLDDGGPK